MTAQALNQIEAGVASFGFSAFGWLEPSNEDLAGRPDIEGPRSLLLIGNAGDDMWRRFSAEASDYNHSLDVWCFAKISQLAEQFGATALFPVGKPYLPFQRWAIQTGEFFSSPLGLTIHREYGLWHAFRGALLFDHEIPRQKARGQISPCDTCAERPCLTDCPVKAFSLEGYDVPACVRHIRGEDTRDCSQWGCAARRACPVGIEYRYTTGQAAFHMDAFKRTFE